MNERLLFDRALEIPDPQKRREFLDQACATDTELRARVDALLHAQGLAGAFLEVPALEQIQPGAPPSLDRTTDFTPQTSDGDESNPADARRMVLELLQPSTKPGSLGVLGHYEVVEVLGQGGFGIVLKAFDEKLHRLVAIKMMNPVMAATSPPRKRFLREARAAAAIRHENILQVYSVEEQPLPYLVMEYIAGETLQQKMDQAGPLEPAEVLHIGRQIASGLAAAHGAGLIHRDIKPGNILLEQGAEQRVKITDFGLARAADDATMTRTGVVSGTPMYMAPEQASGQALDHRSDLFSLGSVLYQMTCGRPPFRASTTLAVLRRVADETPRPLQEILPEIPDFLVAIINKLHAKQPEDRFQSAKEVADLLARCQSELQLKNEVTCVPIPKLQGDVQRAGEVPAEPFASARRGSPDPAVPADRRSPLPGESTSIDGDLRSSPSAGSGDPRTARDPHTARGAPRKLTAKSVVLSLLLAMLALSPILFGRHLSSTFNKWFWPAIPTLPSTEIATGLRFDGKDDYVKVGPIDLSSPQYTLEAFVTSAKDGDNGVIALLKNVEKTPELMYLYDGYPSGQRQSGAGIIGQKPYQSVNAPLPSGTREHRALVFDGSAMHYYVNGIWQGKRYCTAHKGMMWEMRELYIGCKAIETEFFRGQIDQLRLSKIARYNNNFTVVSKLTSDDSTLALYNFDEGQGDTLIDASGHGHHGKIVGATWVSPNSSSSFLSQSESTDSTNPDRRAAEYVLSIGGKVTIKENEEEREIVEVGKLSRQAFELVVANLGSNPKLNDAGLTHLRNCKQLRQIDLGRTPVTDVGMVHLKEIETLKNINLEGTQVGDAGVANLKDCRNLIQLVLGGTRVTDVGLAHFKNCKKIEHLILSYTKVSDEGLIHFKDCDLRFLILNGTRVSDEGLVYFTHCKNLTHLYLDYTQVSDAGVAHFKDCKNLMYLDLSGTKVTDAGLAHFADFPKLVSVKVIDTKVTEVGVKKLSAALPGCKIEWDGGVIEPKTDWHGWPSDAPPPAIAPFDAEQAKQHQEAWATYLGVPVEYTNSIGMKFRLIPPGEFMMGSTPAEIEAALESIEDKHWKEFIQSEAPKHKVILTQPLYLGSYEVTQTQYEQVMGKNPSRFSTTGRESDKMAGIDTTNHPVDTVSWNDAAEFCAKLSQQEKLKPFYFRVEEMVTPLDGTGYRLPTEAVWEFSCRAGNTTKFWIGDNVGDLPQAGWFDRNSGGRTHAVGELKANPFGLYDISGNVFEWVQDWWEPTYYAQFQGTPVVDPSGPSHANSERVIRGGRWDYPASDCRTSFRNAATPTTLFDLGFRVSLPVDAVRQILNVNGLTIVSPWDDLDPAQIPEAERVPRQPEGLVAVLGQHRRRVWNTIYSTSVSPDGTQFLLTTEDGLYLFGRDPKQPAQFFNLGVRHSSATFLPDGRIAAFVTDGVVNKTQLFIFAKPRDGMPLEKQAATNTNNNELIHHATVSSDGHWLAAFDQSEGICLWSLGDAPPQRATKLAIPTSQGAVLPVSFSPDAHWFCFTHSSQGEIHLIDLRGDTPHEATVLKANADEKSDAPAKGFEHAAFLSDGRLATADRNGRIWFWKINDGEPQRVGSIRDTGRITAAAQSLRLAVHNVNVDFRVWDLAADPPQLLGTASSSFLQDNVSNLAIAPNGETVFTGHNNGAVRFWTVSQSGVTELDPLIPNPRNTHYGRTQVADRLLCAARESSRLGIWRPTRDGLQAVPIESPAFMVLNASPTRRQLIVRESLNGGGTALLRYDADRVTPTRRITGDSVYSAALNDEGHRLAIGRHNGADFVIELWGWESDDLPARKLSEIKSSPEHVLQLAFAEAGRTLVGRVGPRVQIWDLKDDQLISRTILPPHHFYQFAVSPDGQTLATPGDFSLELWNLKSDLTKPTAIFTIGGTSGVAFSPDGRRLAASFWENGASAGVQIIQLASGVVEKRLTFPGRVHELTITDDSRHLITGNANATIYVVRLAEPSNLSATPKP